MSGTGTPRPYGALALVSLIFGPHAAMLWQGRGWLALLYFMAEAASILGYTCGVALGWLPTFGTEPLYAFALVGLPVVALGTWHSLAIASSATKRPWYTAWYSALTLFPIISFCAAVVIRTFLFQPFNAPSESSHPNLVVGDYFFVNKLAYGYSRYSFPFGLAHFEGRIFGSHPKRGDIAVFKLPRDERIDYVKRVIGLPGDRVQMVGGRLHLNGVEVLREPVSLADVYQTNPGMKFKFYRETLPDGASYVIADIVDSGPADDTREYVVPEGHYFVLGDNRDNSVDSRFLDRVGYIPENNFIGPVAFRFWTAAAIPLRERPPETAEN